MRLIDYWRKMLAFILLLINFLKILKNDLHTYAAIKVLSIEQSNGLFSKNYCFVLLFV